MAVNPMDYSGKDTVLDVVRTERANFYNIVDDPDNWYVQTRCSEWEVRDLVGHMIDVTEGYLSRWDMARNGEPADSLGWQVMSEKLNENAQAFRSLPREEAISRLKADSDKMLTIFDALTPDEWANFMVIHPYTGPVPAFCYPNGEASGESRSKTTPLPTHRPTTLMACKPFSTSKVHRTLSSLPISVFQVVRRVETPR